MAHGAYRVQHPLAAVIMHWVNLVSMLVLIVTGLYIHRPFGSFEMETMRTLHFIFMYILFFNCVARVFWAFVGKTTTTKTSLDVDRDFKNFGMQPQNKGKLFSLVKYYLFIQKEHPLTAKYNTMQKLTYVTMAALIAAQAYTGFGIYTAAFNWPIYSFFGAGVTAVGGLMAMRVIHYLIMWVFIILTMIHAYLANAEDFVQMPLMFFFKETPEKSH